MNTVTLPFDEAVKLFAKELQETDQRKWPDELVPPEFYVKEATEALQQFGESYIPEYDDHHFIKVLQLP